MKHRRLVALFGGLVAAIVVVVIATRPAAPVVHKASGQGTTLPSSTTAPTTTVARTTPVVRTTPTTAPTTTLAPSTTVAPTTTVPVPAGTPTGILFPSVGNISAETVISEAPTGTGANWVFEPPAPSGPNNTGPVAWDAQTAKPGGVGIAIIAGHDEYDGASDFWDLDELPVGAPVVVQYSSGQTLQFVVTGGKSELKTDTQHDASVWGSADFPELVVMTCDKNSPVVNHHHLSNFILYTKLVE